MEFFLDNDAFGMASLGPDLNLAHELCPDGLGTKILKPSINNHKRMYYDCVARHVVVPEDS
jgi:hypothetical protein